MEKKRPEEKLCEMRTAELLGMGEAISGKQSPCAVCKKQNKENCGSGCMMWNAWFVVQWRRIRASVGREADV